MEEILHVHMDAHSSVHGMAVLGSSVFPELFSTGFAMAKIFFIFIFFFFIPPSTHTDCSDSNKMKQRIEFVNELFR